MSAAVALREQVLEILRRHVSSINAAAVLRVSEQYAGIAPGMLAPSDLPRLFDALRARLPVFMSDAAGLARCMTALDAALGSDRAPVSGVPASGGVPVSSRGSAGAGVPASSRGPASGPRSVVRVEVAAEDDIVTARGLVRRVSQELGFSPTDQLKITTAVSELARNIMTYAKRGTIEIHPLTVPQVGLEVVARDHGPGIANLDAVLAGRYKSKLGMGMGLRGTKNLMDEMHVQTALGVGTTVRARKYRR